MEGHSCPWGSLFEDRVLGVGRVGSCCTYQGVDCVWAHQCTVAVLMQSNWLSGPGGSLLFGCIRKWD